MEKIYNPQKLEPYFKIAEEHAHTSPCSRRQYAAMIAFDHISDVDALWTVQTNSRVSRCCGPTGCARDLYKARHGRNVEIGAEIHAETAALIETSTKGQVFILVGFSDPDSPLYGTDVYPCHTCALNIKFAGYKHIYIRTDKDTIRPVSIAEVIEYREQEWEGDN